MSNRGGRRSTTWRAGWNAGKTKVIRVPIAFADDLYEIARKLDADCPLQDKQVCQVTDNEIKEALSILDGALEIPGNKGKAIKAEIQKAIELLAKTD